MLPKLRLRLLHVKVNPDQLGETRTAVLKELRYAVPEILYRFKHILPTLIPNTGLDEMLSMHRN